LVLETDLEALFVVRITGVDVLRGMLAFAVMVYHLLMWSNHEIYTWSPNILEVVAVTSVEIFFVISGFSLFYIYKTKLVDKKNIYKFYLKRIFRIAPLFYFLLVILIVLKYIAEKNGISLNRPLELALVLENITFAFGLINPADSLLVGGWSIGVEMVMYLMLPVFLLFSRTLLSTVALCIFAICVVAVYSEYTLLRSEPLYLQWKEYTYFANHIHFFVGGFVVLYLYSVLKDSTNRAVLVMCGVLLLFLIVSFLYIQNFPANVLLSSARYPWFVLCLMVVLLFALFESKNKTLMYLGDISYSVYLSHYFIFIVVSRMITDKTLVVIFSVLGTILFAALTTKYLEMMVVSWSKTRIIPK
jgi:exopolysaccharide production protein ExoZ